MGAEDIYHKTEKGRTEIATRVNKLGLRERSMLIMVDDKTSRRGLLSKNAHPTSEGILNNLLADGYIEIAGGSQPVVEATPAAVAPAGPAANQPQVEVSLKSASNFACHALLNYLGPGADDLTGLIEKCTGLEDLTARLEKCRAAIQSLAGKRKADEFWAGVSARLPQE